MNMSVKGIAGDAHFYENSLSLDRIRKLLDNKTGSSGKSEKLEAMKSLMAMVSKGEDVSSVFADVVKNVIAPSVEIKKLVYMYLVHYADADASCRELALLSINSFQKDLADMNPLIRALALRVMTSIRVVDILQIQLIAIRKCAVDESPYVRKCAANALSKLYHVDPTDVTLQDTLAEIIGQLLLHDRSNMVLGSAILAFDEVCPGRVELLHPCFRKICHLLVEMDEWGQMKTLEVLMRYARTQFLNPVSTITTTNLSGKSRREFYSDSDNDSDNDDSKSRSREKKQENDPFHLSQPTRGSIFSSSSVISGVGGGEEIDADHRLLLRSSLPLLKSNNSGVVLAVATLHYYCGTTSMAASTLIGKSLVRIMHHEREIQYVVLNVVATMARDRPLMFVGFLSDFFIRDNDPAYVRRVKLEILTSLTDDESVEMVLREFQEYVKHGDKTFVTETIKCLGQIADALPSIADKCLDGLMILIRGSCDPVVVAQTIIVLRQLLQAHPTHASVCEIVRQLAVLLFDERDERPTDKTLEPQSSNDEARASIVWILGEFQHVSSIAGVILDALRMLTRGFVREDSALVKLQILNFAVKVTLHPSQSGHEHASALLQYILELCKYDLNVDVRDRARLIKHVLQQSNASKILMTEKPTPVIGSSSGTTGLDQSTNTNDFSHSKFTLGSLSNLVNHQVSGYEELPQWPTSLPENSAQLREQMGNQNTSSSYNDQTIDSTKVQASKSKSTKKSKKKKEEQTFYSSSDDDADSSGDSSDSDDSNSNSNSSNGEDESSEVESSDSSDSDSEDSSDDSDDSNSEDENEEPQVSPRESYQKIASKKLSKKPAKVDVFDHFDLLSSSNMDVPPAPPSENDLLNQMMTLSTVTNDTMTNMNGMNMDHRSPKMMNSAFQATGTAQPRYCLLMSSTTDNNPHQLQMEYTHLKDQVSMYASDMFVFQVWIRNDHPMPLTNIRLSQSKNTFDGQQLIPFPEIPVLHSGQVHTCQLHVNFGLGIQSMLLCVQSQVGSSIDIPLVPRIESYLRSTAMSLEEFHEGKQSAAWTNAVTLATKAKTAPHHFQSLAPLVLQCFGQLTPILNMTEDRLILRFAAALDTGGKINSTSSEYLYMTLEQKTQLQMEVSVTVDTHKTMVTQLLETMQDMLTQHYAR